MGARKLIYDFNPSPMRVVYKSSDRNQKSVQRFTSLDPLMSMFPEMSPYVAFNNNPIYYTDPLGLAATGDKKKKKNKEYENADESASIFSRKSKGTVVYYDNGSRSVNYTNRKGELVTKYFKQKDKTVYGINPDYIYVLTPNGFEPNRPYDGFKISGKDLITLYTVSLYSSMAEEEKKAWAERDIQARKDLMYSQNILCQMYELSLLSSAKEVYNCLESDELGLAALYVVLEILPGEADNAVRAMQKMQKHHLIPNQIFRDFKLKQIDGWNQNHKKNLIELPTPFHGNHPAYNAYVKTQLTNIAKSGGMTLENVIELQNQLRMEINKLNWNGVDNLNTIYKSK